MNYKVITFLVLTKSAKNSGICVAGIDMATMNLVRLVSDETGTQILKESFYYNGKEINALDVIDVEVIDSPLRIQIENKILKRIIKYRKHLSENELISITRHIHNGKLLNNTLNTFSKYDDNCRGSLMLLVVKNLATSIKSFGEKKRTKAIFQYQGTTFENFSVTDFDYFQEEVYIKHCVIVISMSEKPYKVDGLYHYFIAKIIPLSKQIVQPKACSFTKEENILLPINIGNNTYDVTIYARHILRVVYETQGKYGINAVIKALTGSSDQFVINHGLLNYKSYGKLKGVNKELIKNIIKSLLKKKFLIQTTGPYPLISIGPNALKIKEEKQYYLDEIGLIKKEQKKGNEQLQEVDQVLFNMLKELRIKLAQSEQVPLYSVCSNNILRQICVVKPSSKEEFLSIYGLGETKYQKYGQLFIDLITRYINN